MPDNTTKQTNTKRMSVFERYLTVWVSLCIVGGIILGKLAPGFAKTLDGMAIYVGKAPVVSIPIAICLFFIIYPIMVKIDFAEVNNTMDCHTVVHPDQSDILVRIWLSEVAAAKL